MNTQVLKIFRALSDPTRVKMVQGLLLSKEVSCADLSKKFSLSQPTLSHHFSKLADAKILKVRKVRTSHFYSIDKNNLRKLGLNIEKILMNN